MASTTTTIRPPQRRWTESGPIDGAIDRAEAEHLEARREAAIAAPLPLGLFGFSIGTVAIAWVLAGWANLPSSFVATVPALLLFAGIAQFIAGLYALSRTNSWEGTAMTVYGANYGALAAFLWMRHIGVIPFTHTNMLIPAVDLFCMGYVSLALAVGALNLSRTYVAMTACIVVGYCLVGIQFLGSAREPASSAVTFC
jgi:uncharacterized protein